MKKLVSIVVPVYNAEKYISSCIHALQAQDYPNIEIILVDDGSSDKSPIICDRFAEKDKKITVFHKENGGVSSARNKGIEIAKGHYLMFADSDDLYERDMVSRMVKIAEDWDADYVICSYRLVKSYEEAMIPINNCKAFEPVWAMTREEFFGFLGYMMCYRETMFAPWNKLFVTNIVQTNKIIFPEDMSYGEDLIFNLRYLEFCNKIIETREKLYNYIVQNPESLELQYKQDLFENQKRLYMEAKEFMVAHDVYGGYNVSALSEYYARRICHCILSQAHKDNRRNEFERRKYVEDFFGQEDVVETIKLANIQESAEQRKLTELVWDQKYDMIYDELTKHENRNNSRKSCVRYKIEPEEARGLGWISVTFKSIKKYGLKITIKRIAGKVNRKLWRK